MFGEVRLTSQDRTYEHAVPEKASRTSARITTLVGCLLENDVTGRRWGSVVPLIEIGINLQQVIQGESW